MSTSWYRKSVWSDYHFDMNVQVAAWPLWAANHDEEFLSLLRLLEERAFRGAVTDAVLAAFEKTKDLGKK